MCVCVHLLVQIINNTGVLLFTGGLCEPRCEHCRYIRNGGTEGLCMEIVVVSVDVMLQLS